MRLIDADALKEVSEIQMANFNSIDGVRAWIDRQPTAYDVEKVEKENKQLKCRCRALSRGVMCFFCPSECEYRTDEFRGNLSER